MMLLALVEAAKDAKFETKFVKYDQSGKCKSKNDTSVSYASSFTIIQ